jgi:uncharacterized protein (UPF0332 family)
MAILNPEHLLDQADTLLAQTRGGPRRQIDLRRAISAAYYSVFHTVTIAAADRIVGRGKRSTPQYTLIYRSVDHRTLGNFCNLASRPSLPPKYQICCPVGGLGTGIQMFSRSVCDLQQQRHYADYDPGQYVELSEAKVWVDLARRSIREWAAVQNDERDAFLLLLLFPPR